MYLVDIVSDVPIYHHLQDHRERRRVRLDVDGDNSVDIGVRHVHPRHTSLMGGLDRIFSLSTATW